MLAKTGLANDGTRALGFSTVSMFWLYAKRGAVQEELFTGQQRRRFDCL
jgi:hypothetical protein